MVDRHVHLERGPYTKEWVSKFVKQAEYMGINKLYLLEHTHRFKEFEDIYEDIFKDPLVAKEQTEWFYKNPKLKLSEYIDLIEEMKKEKWSVEVCYGLEVCYFPNKEDELKACLGTYDWDFLTGSVPWIDGWGFDNPKTKWSWEQKDINEIYRRYYEIMIQLVASGLFDVLAHPDSIKCFGYYPSTSMKETYNELARNLKAYNLKTEFSSGLYINYNHKELGMNKELLKILLEHEVEIVTVSDAHRPEDVGKYIKEGIEIIKNYADRR